MTDDQPKPKPHSYIAVVGLSDRTAVSVALCAYAANALSHAQIMSVDSDCTDEELQQRVSEEMAKFPEGTVIVVERNSTYAEPPPQRYFIHDVPKFDISEVVAKLAKCMQEKSDYRPDDNRPFYMNVPGKRVWKTNKNPNRKR